MNIPSLFDRCHKVRQRRTDPIREALFHRWRPIPSIGTPRRFFAPFKVFRRKFRNGRKIY